MATRLRRTVAACRAEGKKQPPRAVMSRAAKRVRALIARKRDAQSGSVSVRRESRLIETADDVLEMTSFVQDPRSVASGLGSV